MKKILPIIFVFTILIIIVIIFMHFNKAASQTKQIKINDQLSIGYELIGHGDTIVLCQGAYLNMHAWDPEMLAELSKQYSILLWDYPGIGVSSAIDNFSAEQLADILKQILTSLNIKPQAVLGYSMGGFVAQVFAIKYPHDLKSLILVSTYMGENTKSKPVFQTGTSMQQGTLSEKLPAMMPYLFSEKSTEDKLRVKMQKIFHNADNFGSPSAGVIKQEQQLAAEWMTNNLFRKHLTELSVPALILAGEQDHLVTLKQSKELARLIRNSTLVLYPNTGHGLMFQYPLEAANAIIKFISSKT